MSDQHRDDSTADPRRFAVPYRIRFDEAGGDGCLPPSGFVRYAQDVAWQHSDARGFDRAWYAEREGQWLGRWGGGGLGAGAGVGSAGLGMARGVWGPGGAGRG